MEVLREGKRVHPDAWWWVKADGCDIVSGLKESTKKEWSGDVDLNNGEIHELHSQYIDSLRFLDLGSRRAHQMLILDFKHLQKDLETHLTYLSSSKRLA